MPDDECQETFTVALTGSGIDIRREVSANKLALIMSVIMGGGAPDGVVIPAANVGGPARTAKVSLREFLDEAKATKKSDQIVAIGQYMAVHEGRETFSRDDIKARFQSARERMPSNFPRDFGVAIGKAMIAEDNSNAGQYYVTKTGEQAVKNCFEA